MRSRCFGRASTSTSKATSSLVETCPEASESTPVGLELTLVSRTEEVFVDPDIAFAVVRVVLGEENQSGRWSLKGQETCYSFLCYSHALITPSLSSVELTWP
jgi:hypothetical protein